MKSAAAGVFQPVLGLTFLPGCNNCGAPHPHARKPPLSVEVCPDCGTSIAQPGATVDVPAVVTGRSHDVLFARALLALGNLFFFLAKGR